VRTRPTIAKGPAVFFTEKPPGTGNVPQKYSG
jgi:hypothetical protein